MPENIISYFMKTRKGNGKRQTQAIIDFLKERLSVDGGWVQAKDIQKNLVKTKIIPPGPALFRLLEDLEIYRVIER
jgi:hypothetical protein